MPNFPAGSVSTNQANVYSKKVGLRLIEQWDNHDKTDLPASI